MKHALLTLYLTLSVLGWTQESLTLTIQDQALSRGAWGESVDEYRIFTFADGLISRIDYRNLQAQFPPTSTKVVRTSTSVAWAYDRRLSGRELYRLNREGSRWVGTRTLPAEEPGQPATVFPMVLEAGRDGKSLWADEYVRASLLSGHYFEESDASLVYDLQDKTLLENYHGRLNAKIHYAKKGTVLTASRWEEPDDGGWQEMGRSTLIGKPLSSADPSINALNWKILGSVLPYPVYLPSLLGVTF